MTPYKNIKETKQIINDLKYKLQFSKNKAKDAKTINTLIDTVNAFESMLTERYYTDTIETLLYCNIKEWLMKHEVYDGSPIPLQEMCSGIDFDIENGSQQIKLEVIDILKSHEMQNKIKNNAVADEDYADFDKLLTKLINEFKMCVKWRK